jgi:hypothetical protein
MEGKRYVFYTDLQESCLFFLFLTEKYNVLRRLKLFSILPGMAINVIID